MRITFCPVETRLVFVFISVYLIISLLCFSRPSGLIAAASEGVITNGPSAGITRPSWFNIKFHYLVSATLLRHFYKSYVTGMNLKGDEKVLDFGSGSGAEAVHIADVLSKGKGRLTCLDISPAWLETARNRLSNYNNVDFLLGDITVLDIEESFFDVTVIHFVLHDIDRDARPEIIKAIAKSLKKGGTIFIREPLDAKHGIPADEIRGLMKDGGLEEKEAKFTKSVFVGEMFEAVYVK